MFFRTAFKDINGHFNSSWKVYSRALYEKLVPGGRLQRSFPGRNGAGWQAQTWLKWPRNRPPWRPIEVTAIY